MGTQEPNQPDPRQAEVDWGAESVAPIIEAAGQPPVPVDASPNTPPSTAEQLQRQADIEAAAHNAAQREARQASEQGATMPVAPIMGGGITPVEPPPVPMSPEDAATAAAAHAAASQGAMVLPDSAVVPLSHEDPGLVAAMGAHERLDALESKMGSMVPVLQLGADASPGQPSMLAPQKPEIQFPEQSPEEKARLEAMEKRRNELTTARQGAMLALLARIESATDLQEISLLAAACKDLNGVGEYF